LALLIAVTAAADACTAGPEAAANTMSENGE
jgi:hypothetical protein